MAASTDHGSPGQVVAADRSRASQLAGTAGPGSTAALGAEPPPAAPGETPPSEPRQPPRTTAPTRHSPTATTTSRPTERSGRGREVVREQRWRLSYAHEDRLAPHQGEGPMRSTMQEFPLLISHILRHGQEVHGDSEVVTVTGY